MLPVRSADILPAANRFRGIQFRGPAQTQSLRSEKIAIKNLITYRRRDDADLAFIQIKADSSLVGK
jgi:hypothetical protein